MKIGNDLGNRKSFHEKREVEGFFIYNYDY